MLNLTSGSLKVFLAAAPLPSIPGTCYVDRHAGRGTDCLLEILGYDRVTNTIAYEGAIHTDGGARAGEAKLIPNWHRQIGSPACPRGSLGLSGRLEFCRIFQESDPRRVAHPQSTPI